MSPDTSKREVIEHCKRRFGYAPLFLKAMLDSVESILRGERAPFLEKPECRDLGEEVLWICFSKKVVLASPLR
jgi:hypothetical protein